LTFNGALRIENTAAIMILHVYDHRDCLKAATEDSRPVDVENEMRKQSSDIIKTEIEKRTFIVVGLYRHEEGSARWICANLR